MVKLMPSIAKATVMTIQPIYCHASFIICQPTFFSLFSEVAPMQHKLACHY